MNKKVNNLKIFSPDDARDYKLEKEEKILPEKYEPEKRLPVSNQWSSSMCVSHAISTVLSYCEMKQHGYDEPNEYSRGFIYGNRNGENENMEGMYVRDAIKILQKEGDCLHRQFRWHMSRVGLIVKKFKEREDELQKDAEPYKITSYYRLTTDEEIKQAIYKYGAAVMAYPTRKSNGTDIKPASDKVTGSHAVAVIGWDDAGWIIQNSWGKLYGKGGFFHMDYDYDWKECWSFEIAEKTPRSPAQEGDKICDVIQTVIEIIYWVFGAGKGSE